MVSFSCEVCNDTMVKKKLMGHFSRCPQAYFTCIDCSTTFQGTDFQQHTSCISEAQKYEKALYRGKPGKQLKQESKQEPTQGKELQEPKKAEQPKESKQSKGSKADTVKPNGSKSKPKSKIGLDSIVSDKSLSLSKVIKSLQKKTSTDKKDLLKQIAVSKNASGDIILTLN